VHGGGIAVDKRDFLYNVTAYDYTIKKYDDRCRLIREYKIKLKNNPYYIHPSTVKNNMTKEERHKWYISWTPILDVEIINEYLIIRYPSLDGKNYLELFSIKDDGLMYLKTIEFPQNAKIYCNEKYLFRIIPGVNRLSDKDVLNPSIYKYKFTERK